MGHSTHGTARRPGETGDASRRHSPVLPTGSGRSVSPTRSPITARFFSGAPRALALLVACDSAGDNEGVWSKGSFSARAGDVDSPMASVTVARSRR